MPLSDSHWGIPLALNWLTRRSVRICLSLLAFLVVAALGILAISWQTSQGLRRDTAANLQQSVRLVDMTLDNAAIATSAVENLIGVPCDANTVQALRWQVAKVPNVRTVNLYRQNTIYCASLFGPRADNISTDKYIDGRLMLMRGNSITPDHPLIAYRHDVNGSGVLVGVDGYFLQDRKST